LSGRKTLIDTSAWIEALRVDGNPDVRAAVRDMTAEGDAVLCDMVLLELWNGGRGAAEHRMLRDLETELECVPTTEEVWRLAIETGRMCRTKGVTVPATDLLIYACASHHDLELMHVDDDFDKIAVAAER